MPDPGTKPGRGSLAEIELQRLGLPALLSAQYDLLLPGPEVDKDGTLTKRAQVRDSSNYAPTENVDRYAVQMAESEFPPIIVTLDDYIADGNTRRAASLKRKVRYFPAWVIQIKYETASPEKRMQIEALAATMNAQNGQPLTLKERRRHCASLIKMNWKNEQIARALGIPTSQVTSIRQEADARARIMAVGIKNGRLREPSLRALGKVPVLALNNAPYVELVRLAEDAALKADEIITLAREAKETGSDTAALQRLAEVRKEMEERIRQNALTGVGNPSPAAMLRRFSGWILRYTENPGLLAETVPAVMFKHRDILSNIAAVAQGALARQDSLIEEAGITEDDDDTLTDEDDGEEAA